MAVVHCWWSHLQINSWCVCCKALACVFGNNARLDARERGWMGELSRGSGSEGYIKRWRWLGISAGPMRSMRKGALVHILCRRCCRFCNIMPCLFMMINGT